MEERPFEVGAAGGILHGHVSGNGSPALLLHGGPGLADYTAGCAAELDRTFTIFRYTQRGALPSTVGPPYSVETHMADAIAVLDAFGLEQAWAIGHSWGGHLALHLAVAHPERLYGVVCIDPLGASAKVIPEFQENLLRALSEAERARAKELDELAERGEASHEELLELRQLVWPFYFADPASAPPPLTGARQPGLPGRDPPLGQRALRGGHAQQGAAGRGAAGALRARRPGSAASASLARDGEADPRGQGRPHSGLRPLPLARAARLHWPARPGADRPALTAVGCLDGVRDAGDPRRPGARSRHRSGDHADLPDLDVRAGAGRRQQGLRLLARREPDPRGARDGAREPRGRRRTASRSPRASGRRRRCSISSTRASGSS